MPVPRDSGRISGEFPLSDTGCGTPDDDTLLLRVLLAGSTFDAVPPVSALRVEEGVWLLPYQKSSSITVFVLSSGYCIEPFTILLSSIELIVALRAMPRRLDMLRG